MQYKHNKELVSFARSLRKNMTKEERRLWYEFLREYPVKFQRQKILGKYIVDFYCAKAGIVVELDGSQHYEGENQKQDDQRTEVLREYGITVIRIPNNELMKNFRGVCEYIDRVVQQAVNMKKEKPCDFKKTAFSPHT